MLSPRQARVRRAFLVAPLAGPVALAVGIAGQALLDRSAPPGYALDTVLLILPGFVLFGLPFAYAVGLVAGLPCYWLLKRVGWLHLLPILAIAGILGPIALFAATRFWTGSASAPMIGVPAGMAAGFTFWALGVRGVPEDGVA